ncbi:anti-anti-sigma factor [Actinoplanes lutulentus]|uniref:Anti-anti-sigma factor n=1 Tax=Actinoplanes lutulentus TaxID=1287878 RepID=A0A327Z685_9ACTN|nr:STAS domain-containing protein [Actinoplanes lutulentus]MBB2948856.1 anti-anti-sigma factor [Actinoplanes lutulentus]RAK29766.1 anti-anti-sigma factor [Actinoplanes lutulentus]
MSTEYDSEPYVEEVELRLTVTEAGSRCDAVVVEVAGELDIGTTAIFHGLLSAILDGRSGQPLELDLTGLEFCDLSGLRALHALGSAEVQQRNRVRIAAAGSALDLLLNLCRIPAILGYVPEPLR